jgi:SAM-dependent methyltransferase
MRAECGLVSPGLPVVAGSAEALPLAAAMFDLVTVAQAFHWFAPQPALHELARLLRPGGALALVWNERDTSLPWTAALDEVLRRAGDAPYPPPDALRPRFDGNAHFEPFTLWRTEHRVTMTATEVEHMVASRSYVRVLDPDHRTSVLSEVRQVVAPLPEPIVMPYTTVAYCARARAAPCTCKGAPWSD